MRYEAKIVLAVLAALAALGAIAGAATVFLGLYNVSAREPHLPPVRWALHTTFRNAVDLRANGFGGEVPDLSDPDMVRLGGAHYEAACAVCHAAPGAERTATSRAMRPAPPHILEAVEGWSDREFAWIVYEGVKMSGMPAWPAPRPEEVWPVVAYLRAVQQAGPSGDGTGVAPPAVTPGRGASGAEYCESCHGRIAGRVPRLDIQTEGYLLQALQDYRSGARPSGIMQHAATEVPEGALAELARHFASQEIAAPGGTDEGASEGETATDQAAGEEAFGPLALSPAAGPLVTRGGALARRGTRDVPACTACHGPDPTRGSPDIPALAGQYAPFLEQQLKLWRDGKRGSSGARAELMRAAAQDLSDEEIEALAAWYATLPPAKRSPVTPAAEPPAAPQDQRTGEE